MNDPRDSRHETLANLFEIVRRFESIGPLEYARWLVSLSQYLGAGSLSYNIAPRVTNTRRPRNFTFFALHSELLHRPGDRPMQGVLARCYADVLLQGSPVWFSDLANKYGETYPRLVREISAVLSRRGLVDGYLVPVYGPFNINAVITLAFDRPCTDLAHKDLKSVSMMLPTVHCELVRMFMKRGEGDLELSPREKEVLTWIARGRSRTKIASIMKISESSVDTYTRRIFAKLKVNDRVSAVVKAVSRQLIRL